MDQKRGWDGAWSSKPKVLLIDDDAGVLLRVRHFLEAKGFEVMASENVFQIPSLVSREKPDVVVLDIQMPALSGAGVASSLGTMCDVPIVFYSAVMEEEGRALARQHKGAEFVSKAEGIRALHSRLEAVLRAPGEPREAGM